MAKTKAIPVKPSSRNLLGRTGIWRMTRMRESTVEDYADATDSARSTRYLVHGRPGQARQWQRIKPDEERHAMGQTDWEKEPTRG